MQPKVIYYKKQGPSETKGGANITVQKGKEKGPEIARSYSIFWCLHSMIGSSSVIIFNMYLIAGAS
jgi:hypothetical protein